MPSLAQSLSSVLAAAVEAETCSGATCVVVHDGTVVASSAQGTLASVNCDGSRVRSDQLEPVTDSSWFDLASITKVVSAITLHTVVERGHLGYDEPLATHLEGYRGDPDRERVTLRHLLTHTSGLPDIFPDWERRILGWVAANPGRWLRDWPLDDRRELRAQVERLPLLSPPQKVWRYSCVGYNTAMLLAERATGQRWADLVQHLVLDPLGLGEIAFAPPSGADDGRQVAATEVDTTHARGLVRGVVHDEFSWALGGRCANAGLFGTARAVAALAEAIRLDQLPCSRDGLWLNEMPALLGRAVCDPDEAPWGHSMGLRIGQLSWMWHPELGEVGRRARGHTGFTGTSVFTDDQSRLTVSLMTNRVHPTREGADAITPLRSEVARLAHQHVMG
ncbi:serine hydrolase domain-containing protein [Aestuariimicrobium kwangyangense]|uniref:serine hydrolase domain-containing protein n=1 Tax=Aestuariimicrobium kwangyangense TaxID=396389 RepID=UPI0003B38A45|nr:serine hydrolase domain-containing protein [Aestuariimicrobium kwangyangense]